MNDITPKVEHLWDPLKRNLLKGMYTPTTPNTKRFLKAYNENPSFFFVQQMFCMLPGVLFLLLLFTPVGMWIWNTIIGFYGPGGIGILFGVFTLLAGWNYAIYSPVKNEVTALLLAKEMNWESFDHSIQKHWFQMKTALREVFDKGTRSQSFAHQFWGQYKETPFWMAQWKYITDTGKGRSAEFTQTKKQVVIFPCNETALDGQRYESNFGVVSVHKKLVICVLDDLFFRDLQQSLFFADRAIQRNKIIIEQKMCSVFRFKESAMSEIRKKIRTPEYS